MSKEELASQIAALAGSEAVRIGLAVTGGLVAGWIAGRLGRRSPAPTAVPLRQAADRPATEARARPRREPQRRSEPGNVSNLVRFLPGFVRDLNRSDLDPRDLPELVVKLACAVFRPEQVLVYLVPSPGKQHREPPDLFLRAHRGLEPVPRTAVRVSLGSGKIGWAAANKVEMASEDWANVSRTGAQSLRNNHPSFHLDLIGPLLHHSSGKDQVLGVVCVGKPATRTDEDKLLLQMVTNLASIALMNAHHVGQIKEQADHDGLTGLLNKRAFMHKLGLMINKAESVARPLGVFIFDIDHFKCYNDTNGHVAGDELLRDIPRLLRANVRPHDLVARYGGEEFIMAFPDSDLNATYEAAERIRAAIEAYAFPHQEKQPQGNLTISGGVAACPIHGNNGTELIQHADQALYESKEAGRNRVTRYRGVHIGSVDDEADGPHLMPLPGTALER